MRSSPPSTTWAASSLGLASAPDLFFHTDQKLIEVAANPKADANLELVPHRDSLRNRCEQQLRPAKLKLASLKEVLQALAHRHCKTLAKSDGHMDT